MGQDIEKLELLELLILYDALHRIGYLDDLSHYEIEIRKRLGASFPFYKATPYLLMNLQQYDYMDTYNYAQPLYYILKYRHRLLLDYDDGRMCQDLQRVVVHPWQQLSLIKLYNNSCE